MKKLKVTKTTTKPPVSDVWGDNDRQQMPAGMQASYKKIYKKPIPKGTTVSQEHIDRWRKDPSMVSTNFDVVSDDPKPKATATATPKPKVTQKPVGKLKPKPTENVSSNRPSPKPKPMQEQVSSTFSTKSEKMLGSRSGMKGSTKTHKFKRPKGGFNYGR
jgi:hypothetical protein